MAKEVDDFWKTVKVGFKFMSISSLIIAFAGTWFYFAWTKGGFFEKSLLFSLKSFQVLVGIFLVAFIISAPIIGLCYWVGKKIRGKK